LEVAVSLVLSASTHDPCEPSKTDYSDPFDPLTYDPSTHCLLCSIGLQSGPEIVRVFNYCVA